MNSMLVCYMAYTGMDTTSMLNGRISRQIRNSNTGTNCGIITCIVAVVVVFAVLACAVRDEGISGVVALMWVPAINGWW